MRAYQFTCAIIIELVNEEEKLMQLGCNSVTPNYQGCSTLDRGKEGRLPNPNCLHNVILDLWVNRLMISANRSALSKVSLKTDERQGIKQRCIMNKNFPLLCEITPYVLHWQAHLSILGQRMSAHHKKKEKPLQCPQILFAVSEPLDYLTLSHGYGDLILGKLLICVSLILGNS